VKITLDKVHHLGYNVYIIQMRGKFIMIMDIPDIYFDIYYVHGKKVSKKSNKPFKSSLKINTIKSITINPNTSMPAFTFFEDESVVDMRTCVICE
jgi:hypothetical protein